MSSTVRLSLDLTTRDLATSTGEDTRTARDTTATTHDLVDSTPLVVSTSGAVGANFVPWPTSVAQIERVASDAPLPLATDVYLRWGGAVASCTGTLSTPSGSLSALTLVLSVDGGNAVTTTFDTTDTTIALAAKRINYAHAAQVASVDTAGKLKLSGARTGSADAKAASRQYGELTISGSSTALSALGLTAGVYSGAGTDERVGAGPYARSFPSTALPRALEISGSCSGARLTLAGKAS